MATIQIMQGDSRAIFLNFTVNGAALTPDMIDDLEVMIGDDLRLAYSEDTVKYDASRSKWYIWPTQEQTFALDEGTYKPEIRSRFHNQNTTNVKGFIIDDKIKVIGARSREVL